MKETKRKSNIEKAKRRTQTLRNANRLNQQVQHAVNTRTRQTTIGTELADGSGDMALVPNVVVSRHSQLPVGLCRDPSPGGVMAKPRIDPNDLGKRTGSCPDPVWAYCGRARMEVARGRTPCGVFRLLPAGRARGP